MSLVKTDRQVTVIVVGPAEPHYRDAAAHLAAAGFGKVKFTLGANPAAKLTDKYRASAFP